MFAIIETSGRQFEVQPEQLLSVDLQDGLEVGAKVTFDQVLLANGGGASVIGLPTIAGATVQAEVVEPLQKGPKLEIQKKRRRRVYKRHTGHRQKYTLVKILSINVPGLAIVEAPAPAPAPTAP